MQAFHNDEKIKAKYITRLKAHYDADEIVKGVYWEHGKGCAVGCTIHSSSHAAYETELGIPAALARLEDSIFEGLPNADAKEFPLRFLNAINVGADLSLVTDKFLHWLLVDGEHGVIKYVKNKKIMRDVADLYTRKITSDAGSRQEWCYADYADAADAYVADAYADAASAADAADAAAYAAAYADAADGAAYAARTTARSTQAEKLIDLLTQAK